MTKYFMNNSYLIFSNSFYILYRFIESELIKGENQEHKRTSTLKSEGKNKVKPESSRINILK